MARRLLFSSRRRGESTGFDSLELRDAERQQFLFKRRLGVAGTVVLVAFGALFTRFVYLQIVQHRYYQTLAETNRIAIVPIVPNRGVITDRNGIVLAQSYSAYTLELTPSRIKSLDATIDELATIVDIQPRDRKRFRKLLDESKNFESMPLRTRLSDEEVARFAVNRYRFPGVDIKARLFRQYPFGEVASHVVGYIGRITDRDLERIAGWEETANYKGSDYIGKVGIELSYERELHGTTGVEQVEVDAGGRAVRTLAPVVCELVTEHTRKDRLAADRADWRETLKKTDVPVLFVAGEESPFWPKEHVTVSAALCPRGESAVVAGSGHAVNWECPKEFNAVMLKFLAKVGK
jgi:hypothetical protein